jgi:predicted homoserine dehydrogenase-like protein
MYEALKALDAAGRTIRVALVGAGAMGVGIAWQIGHTPGMRLVAVTDLDDDAARRAADAYGGPWARVGGGDPPPSDPEALWLTREPFYLQPDSGLAIDLMVEATNTVAFAAEACLAAIERGLHVVLMNAEVDLALGPLLQRRAEAKGVVVTSDAGDQHGVLASMIDEIRLWGFRIVMAGNIKGFLDRYATAEGLREEAAKRNLNPIQCCAYTDGTKLNVEMALVANGTGLVPFVPGMEGPRAADVREVFEHFDFDRYGDLPGGAEGVVDYLLGAEPGGGVYVIGHCDDPLQQQYLWYYKLGDGPYYLFYRPYHLCHLETTRAIARAVLDHQAVLRPTMGRVADVYAHAKRDLKAGTMIEHGIGSDEFYGLVERCDEADPAGRLPIALLDAEPGMPARLLRDLARDEPLGFADLTLADSRLLARYREQAALMQPAN